MASWLIWIAMAVLAAVAVLPLLAPLARKRVDADSSGVRAAAIYRDQLAEIDRDLASGVIAAADAEAARTEIARRLIKAGGEAAPAIAAKGNAARFAGVLIVAMPVAALGLYLLIGSPEYPGQPLATRAIAPEAQDVATLVAAVEAHLASAPDDGAGWEVIAPVYLRLGRNADAVGAYANAIRILGSTAEREASLGDAIVRLNGGKVPADARAAFEKALALAPGEPLPRFYLALALEQDGKRDAALAAWQALLADATDGAPWADAVREQIAGLEPPASPVAPGPSAADVEAAANLAPADRQTMIEGMVASLAAKLETDGSDSEGWARLVRSYMVLSRPDEARDALSRARLALAGDAVGLASVEAAAKAAGLEEGGS